MPSAWLLWRVAKFVGLAVFAAGLWGSVTARPQRARLVAAHGVTIVGLFIVWIAGYGLLKLSGQPLGQGWVLQSMAASLVATGAAQWAATRATVSRTAAAAAAAGFVGATGAMVGRASSAAVGLVVVVPLVAAALAAALAARLDAHHGDPDAAAVTERWFWWIARLEGLSLVVMVGISIPVRVITGFSLDGGQGWIGWIHGALTLVYVVALAVVASTRGWSAARVAVAMAASLVPGGTFLFERRVLATQPMDGGGR